MVLTYLHFRILNFPLIWTILRRYDCQVTQHKVQSGADTWDDHPRSAAKGTTAREETSNKAYSNHKTYSKTHHPSPSHISFPNHLTTGFVLDLFMIWGSTVPYGRYDKCYAAMGHGPVMGQIMEQQAQRQQQRRRPRSKSTRVESTTFATDQGGHSHNMAVCQNLVPLVNIKIAGKWMFIPLKMVLIGIDP